MDNATLTLRGDVRISVGQPTENFITATAAAVVESSLLVFVGYNEMSGVSYLSGVSQYNPVLIPVKNIVNDSTL